MTPAGYLWAATKFDPDRAVAAAAAAESATRLMPLQPSNVVATSKGMRGHVCRIDAKILQELKVPAILRVRIAVPDDGRTTLLQRCAIVWPAVEHPGVGAWLAPRELNRGGSADNVDGLCVVKDADWAPAPATVDTVMGVPRTLLRNVMMSSCARTRWWFAMPHTAPPLSVPKEAQRADVAVERGTMLCTGAANDGLPPLITYAWAQTNPHPNPSVQGAAPITCAWCRAQFADEKTYWAACVPEKCSE